jgi:hypothetical protein
VDRQTLWNWVIRFNAEDIEGLRDRTNSGRPTWLALKAQVLRGPDAEQDGVNSWARRIAAGWFSSGSG